MGSELVKNHMRLLSCWQAPPGAGEGASGSRAAKEQGWGWGVSQGGCGDGPPTWPSRTHRRLPPPDLPGDAGGATWHGRELTEGDRGPGAGPIHTWGDCSQGIHVELIQSLCTERERSVTKQMAPQGCPSPPGKQVEAELRSERGS